MLLRKEGGLSVSEICIKLGYEQSGVSHNLKCLLNCGFVKVRQNGKNRIYRISEEIKTILDGIEKHILEYEKKLISCDILKEEKEKGGGRRWMRAQKMA